MSNCAHRSGGRFCPDCGKDLAPAPYDRKTLVGDLADNWWEKGAIHTLAGLFVHPGQSVRNYIERDRDFLVKPIAYVAIVLAFVYWVRVRFPQLGNFDTSESPALTLLFRDPLVPVVIGALIGAAVVRFVTHRAAGLSFYDAFVLRLYLAAQAQLLMVVIKVGAVVFAVQSSPLFSPIGFALTFGWMGFAIWQYFAPDRLRLGWLRAVGAVVLGEAALFLSLIIPIVVIDEMGWLR